MPVTDQEIPISSVMGIPREHFSRHVFRGGNFLIPRILNQYRNELGVNALPQSLLATAGRSANHLETNAAVMDIDSIKKSDGFLQVNIRIRNLAGHKLPTAYPSRRVWLHVKVTDSSGGIIFESGKLNPDGSIAGNENDIDQNRYEPHYQRIVKQDQVQIYESIMADENGRVTTTLLSGIRYIKDNRILPEGFDKETAPRDCGVYGKASEDNDFQGSGDCVSYQITLPDSSDPAVLQVDLVYQPIGFRWAHNLADNPSVEASRFISYYRTFSLSSATILARQSRDITSAL
jgi:hypothetical protein